MYNKIRSGASAIEYASILALIAAIVIIALASTGSNIACLFQGSASTLASGTRQSTNRCNNNNNQTPVWSQTGTQSSPIILATGTDGQQYSAQIPVAITYDGSAPLYTIVSQSLPNGLSLAGTGLVNGTPSASPSGPGLTATVGIQAFDGQGRSTPISYVKIPINGHLVFAYTGSDQSLTAPAPQLTFKLWGAGGGGNNDNVSFGGAGGYTTGTLTYAVGQSLTVVVGQGGSLVTGASGGTYGGGGNKTTGTVTNGNNQRTGGLGGGRSAILVGGSDVLVAGGGGGAGSSGGSTLYGGSGGGTTGASGAPNAGWGQQDGGTGGSQTAGGQPLNYPASKDPASVIGSIDQGGTAAFYEDGGNGSGGGGYYGGGAGSDNGNGFGGGGSSYVGNAQGASTTAGTNATPGNSGDSDYQARVGVGGSGSSGQPHTGGNGLVVVSWPP